MVFCKRSLVAVSYRGSKKTYAEINIYMHTYIIHFGQLTAFWAVYAHYFIYLLIYFYFLLLFIDII